jgi:Secretion system C-terminal sorting domain/WD40-like Beta Propeller Repeat
MKKSSSLATGLLASLLLFISSNSKAQSPIKLKPELEKNFASTINTPNNCDAYPYLSDDGLRLYFTSERGGGFGRLYYCSRSSINENFDKPKPLSQSLSDGFYAATFTVDELTIFASKDGDIYTAKRNSLTDEFKNPAIIKGLAEGRKFAPSISADGNELIVILDISEKDIAVHYRKNASGNFTEVDRFGAPGKTELDPGQFSKDGLSFYASYDVKNMDEKTKKVDLDRKVQQKIIRFTRRSLADNFTTIEEVPDELNFQMLNHQPTMNKEETIFVVVNSEEDSWGKNELRLVNLNKEDIVDSAVALYDCALDIEKIPEDQLILVDTTSFVCGEEKIEIVYEYQHILTDIITEIETSRSINLSEIISQVKVYPNPFTDNIIVTLEKNDINSNFELFDVSGRKIMTSKLNNSVNRIQLNKHGTGIYIYRLTNSKGKVFATGKLVRK